MKRQLAIKKTSNELHPISVPTKVMSQIGIDLMHMAKANRGYNFIITCVDYFSKILQTGCPQK